MNNFLRSLKDADAQYGSNLLLTFKNGNQVLEKLWQDIDNCELYMLCEELDLVIDYLTKREKDYKKEFTEDCHRLYILYLNLYIETFHQLKDFIDEILY